MASDGDHVDNMAGWFNSHGLVFIGEWGFLHFPSRIGWGWITCGCDFGERNHCSLSSLFTERLTDRKKA